ncbi:MAG: TRAP transporter small permease [Rhodospirillaceae bacterium]|nr:TRAP transporter small permease [Rhodospirillaceae bacterium]
MKVLQTLLDGYYRLLRILVGLMMAAIIVPVAMQVLSRPLDIPLIGEVRFVPRHLWTEEVALFLFIWIVMLGSVIAVREQTHFEVDILPEPNNPRTRGLRRILVHLLMGVMAYFFIVDGWSYFQFGGRQESDYLRYDLGYLYITVPLAGASWGIFLLEHLARDIWLVIKGESAGGGDAPHGGVGDPAKDEISQGTAL